jgi:hypothetical protein
MTAVCAITRPGPQVWNPETLQYEAPTLAVYSGKCRLRATGQQDRGTDAASQVFVESSYVLSLPVAGSESVLKGDTVVFTLCPDDAEVVGRKYSVVAVPAQSHATARRVPIKEAQ